MTLSTVMWIFFLIETAFSFAGSQTETLSEAITFFPVASSLEQCQGHRQISFLKIEECLLEP